MSRPRLTRRSQEVELQADQRQIGQHAMPFGHDGDAAPTHGIGGQAEQVLARHLDSNR
jgi:hypothetical protein